MFRQALLLSILSLSLLSCSKVKIETIKYRERNPIKILKVESPSGNIRIKGWDLDFIEIETSKSLFSGIPADIDLMNTVFDSDSKQLYIINSVPVRVNGKIDLDIHVPFLLMTIIINAQKCDITIADHLGDIELTNSGGSNSVSFRGTIFRSNTSGCKNDISIYSRNSSDIVIKETDGPVNADIRSISNLSFIDISSNAGDINIKINEKIDHNLFIFNESKTVYINYPLIKEAKITDKYYALKALKGKNYKTLTMNIQSAKGKINIWQSKK